MGDMTMAGASTKSLENLHGDIIYITGGESDVAYANASLDYERIDNVPVVFAIIKRRGMEELLQKNMEVLSQKWLSIGSIGILTQLANKFPQTSAYQSLAKLRIIVGSPLLIS